MKRERITEIVGLIRLSKPKKGKSKEETKADAYGIEDQRQSILSFAEREGAKVIAWYTEVEGGTGKNLAKRVEMDKAIAKTKMHNAVLVIGKLDRLARNVHFISGLMEAGVDFVACDNPTANKLTIHILAAVAEQEAETIADRTRRGLAVAKKQGKLLGSARPGHWKGREHLRGTKQANAASAEARTRRAIDAYRFLMPQIKKLMGTKTLTEIAEALNLEGHVTTRGLPFNKSAVYRIVELFAREAA